MKKLNGQSPMPLDGRYKGRKMIEVPVSYLLWYWTCCGGSRKTTLCPVAAYIKFWLYALEAEYPSDNWRG